MSGLKFELRKNSKIKLTVKNRTKILTKEFAFALSVAFFVHFLAFFLFHIDLGLFSTTHEYPTAFVQGSDISAPIDTADHDKPLSVPPYLIFSKQNTPKYPSLIQSSEIALASHETTFDLSYLDLDSMNQSRISHFYLSNGHSFLKEPTRIHSKKLCRGKLEFKASKASGKIFWLDWLESTGDRKLDDQIQAALKTAQLAETLDPVASHGIIEVEFQI